MKYYVAALKQDAARDVIAALEPMGHECIASWVNAANYGPGTPKKTPSERLHIALVCQAEVRTADFMVLVAEPEGQMVPGGKFVELGIALEARMTIYVLGRRENVFAYHPNVVQCDDILQLYLAVGRDHPSART